MDCEICGSSECVELFETAEGVRAICCACLSTDKRTHPETVGNKKEIPPTPL